MTGEDGEIRLALCGDVMLGRGIDQILPHPGDPAIPYSPIGVKSAKFYVQLAERTHGAIPEARGYAYPWGDALTEFEAFAPDIRLINLETAITAGGKPWPRKPIQYRMNPRNIEALTAARIDFCALANNHTVDWGYLGLRDTIKSLAEAGIARSGAGRDLNRAVAPAILPVPGKGRVIVVSFAMPSSKTPLEWAAAEGRPGVNLVEATAAGFDQVVRSIAGIKQPRDVLIASVHAGPNYGYAIDRSERELFLRLIDEAGFDLVHCHSSHHVKAIEVHNGRPLLYGTSDVINDYEGIPKSPEREAYSPGHGLIVLAAFSPETGACTSLRLTPTQNRQLCVRRATGDGTAKLRAILERESARFGTVIETHDGRFTVGLR